MNAVCCAVKCSCGGVVKRLTDDGIFYLLTDHRTIVFQGICDSCSCPVRVERDILSLLLIGPTQEGARVN